MLRRPGAEPCGTPSVLKGFSYVMIGVFAVGLAVTAMGLLDLVAH